MMTTLKHSALLSDFTEAPSGSSCRTPPTSDTSWPRLRALAGRTHLRFASFCSRVLLLSLVCYGLLAFLSSGVVGQRASGAWGNTRVLVDSSDADSPLYSSSVGVLQSLHPIHRHSFEAASNQPQAQAKIRGGTEGSNAAKENGSETSSDALPKKTSFLQSSAAQRVCVLFRYSCDISLQFCRDGCDPQMRNLVSLVRSGAVLKRRGLSEEGSPNKVHYGFAVTSFLFPY